MKRSPLERKTPLRAKVALKSSKALTARRRIPFASKRRQADRERRRDVRMAVMTRAGGRCEAERLVPEMECGGPLDVHEPKTRARGGDYLDPDACVLICRRHHDWVHAHPAVATSVGLLVPSWE